MATFVRERFRAEFAVLRRPGKIYSFREDAAGEESASDADADAPEDVADEL
ncbi:MAG: hypothetical protein ACI4QA_04280 [Candidatus Spyradosoma sp.]